MTYDKIRELVDGLRGLTLAEWKMVREEVDQQFGVKCMRVMLERGDADEIARMVAMQAGLYEDAEAAARQTMMEI